MLMQTPMGKMKLNITGDVLGDRITGKMKAGFISMNFIGTRKK